MGFHFFCSRLFRIVLVLIGVTLAVFLMLHAAPGDPIELLIGEGGLVSEDEIAMLRHQYGLDLPIYQQFTRFVIHAIQGDLGTSFRYGQPVFDVIMARIPATVELTLVAFIIALGIAIPIGLLSAVYARTLVDRVGIISVLLGASIPGFWLGILLILFFGIRLEWLPVSGRIDYGLGLRPVTGLYFIDSLIGLNRDAFVSAIYHVILPAVALCGPIAAVTARMIRTGMLDVLHQPYVTVARAKGLPERTVILKHALRNALIPTVSIVGLQLGLLLGGNMIIETVFGWPGIGRLAVDAIYARDYPLVQGVVLLYAVTYVFLNLAVDLLYTYLNPRVKL